MPDYNDILKKHANTKLESVEPTDESLYSIDGLEKDEIAKETKDTSIADILQKHSGNRTQLKEGVQTEVGISEYEPYIPGFSATKELDELNQARANNQSNWEKAGSVGKQMLGEIVGGSISGLGSIFELPDAIIDEMSGESADFNNFLIEWGEGIKEYAKDSGKIYRTNPDKAFDFGDFGWWAENGVSLSSTIGLMIPATAGVKGLGLISDVLKITDKVSDTAKYWSKLSTSSAIMRNAENMTESLSISHKSREFAMKQFENEEEFQKVIDSELGTELRNNGKALTKENVADLIAAKAGWRSYKVNSANIVFDMVQMAPLFKGFKAGTRTNKVVSSKVDKAIKGHGFDSFGKVTKVSKISRYFNPIISPIARQSTEGIEEGINFIGGAEGEYYGKTLAGGKDTNFGERLSGYLTDGHFYESAAWGVAGGVVFDGATGLLKRTQGYKDNTDDNKIKEIEQRKQTINSYKQAHKEILDNEESTPNQKAESVSQLQDEMATDLAMRASAVGNVDLLLNQIETPQFGEQLVEAGLADADKIQDNVIKLKETILQTEDLYKQYYNKFFVGNETQTVKNHLITESIKLERAITRHSKQADKLNSTVLDTKSKDRVYQNNLEKGLDGTIKAQAINNAMELLKSAGFADRVPNLEQRLKENKVKYEGTVEFAGLNEKLITKINPAIIEGLTEQIAIEEALNFHDEKLKEINTPEYKEKLNADYLKEVAKEEKEAKKEAEKVKKDEVKKSVKEKAKEVVRKAKEKVTGKKDTTEETEQPTEQPTEAEESTTEFEYPNDPAVYNDSKYKNDEEFQLALSQPDSIDTWLEVYNPDQPFATSPNEEKYKILQNKKAEIENNIQNSIFGLNEQDTQTATDTYGDLDKETFYTEDNNKTVKGEQETIDGDLETSVDNVEYTEDNQPVKRDEGDSRVVSGYNILAYLSRGYEDVISTLNDGTQSLTKEDIDDSLNENLLDKNILNPNEYQIGDELTVQLDKSYNVDSATFSSLQASETTTNSLVPIVILKNNKKVAYLHDTNWINENNVAGDIEVQKKKLQEVRDTIANSTEPITIKITNRNYGVLAKTKDNRQIDTINAFPDKNLKFGIGKNGKLFNTRETETSDVVLNKDFNEGAVYAVAQVGTKDGKKQHIGLPLRRKTVNPVISKSIRKAVKLYLGNDKESKEVKDVYDNYGYNLTTIKGLRDYINNFVNVYSLDSDTNLKDKLNTLDSNVNLLTVTTNSIDFGGGKGVNYNSISRESPEYSIDELLNNLEKHLSGVFVDFDLDKINTGEFNIPLLNESSEDIGELSYDNYNDFVKSNTSTNLLSFDLGNGNFAYTIQPVIETNVGSIEKKITPVASTTSETNDIEIQRREELIRTTPGVNRTQKLKVQKALIDNDIDTFIAILGKNQLHAFSYNIRERKRINDKYDRESKDNQQPTTQLTSDDDMLGDDFSPSPEDSDIYKALQQEIEETVLIKGFTASKQSILVDAIAYDINEQVINSGKLQQSQVFNNWLTYFKEQRSVFSEQGRDKVVAEFDKIIDSFDSIKLFTLKKVGKINGIQIKADTTVDGLRDLETHLEKTNFNDEATLQLDSKDTVSVKLKRFFSGVNELDENGKAIKPYMGLKKYVPFDVVYNEVSALLANTPADFGSMVDILEQYTQSKPYLESLIAKLQNTEQQTKDEFVVAMSKHKVDMVFLLWALNKKQIKDSNGNIVREASGKPKVKKEYSMITQNSNSNDIATAVADNWYEGLKSSKYVTKNSDNELVLSADISNVIEKLKKFSKDEPKIDELGDFLKSIGIDIDPRTLNDLKTNGLRSRGKRLEYKQLFNTANGVFNIMLNNLEKTKQSNLVDNNPFKDTSIKSLAIAEAKYNTKEFSNSFKNGEGNTIYSFSNNKYFVDRIRELKTNNKLQKDLLSLSYNGKSEWLQDLTSREDNLFKRTFNYFYLDSIKELGSTQKGKKLSNMSDTEQEITKLGLFWNRNTSVKEKGIDKRIVRMFYPTMSDKTTMVGLTTVAYNTKLALNGDVHKDTINKVYNSLIVPEISRIIKFQEEVKSTGIKGYDKGANIVYSIPEINNSSVFNEDGEIDFDVLSNPTKIKELKDIVEQHIDTLTENKLKYWQEVGINTKDFIDTNYKKFATEQVGEQNMLKFSATDFIVNTLLTNQNAFQLFIGDPALFYKSKSSNPIKKVEDTFENIGKRLASQIAPGMDLSDSENDTYKQGFIDDYISDSKFLDEYSKVLSENDLKEYKGIEGTDAQEFTTVAEHLYVMQKLGKLTDKQIDSIQDRALKGTLSEEELGLIFQPMKPVFVGQHMDKDNDVQRMLYIKSSSFPLVPQLTKGLEIDKLRVAMEHPTKGVDRVSFSTANKVGDFAKPTTVFDTDGNVVADLDLSSTTLKLERKYFKIQQEVPYKASKEKINDGSQQRKLLFANILDVEGVKELKAEYEETYRQLYENDYKDLIQELDVQPDGSFDRFQLHDVLIKEAEDRNYSINDIQSLKIDEKGHFVYPLAFNNSASKFEALLTSIVDNRVRKKKFRGNSYVLGTEEGFKFANSVEETNLNASSIVYTKDWTGELRPQRSETVDGKKVVQPAEILIPFKFRDKNGKLLNAKDFVNADGTLDTTKLDEDILKTFGFRIPTQGLNSMSYMKVVGFLPKSAGDLIIAPREFTIQMGSDFDVDKLYSYMYNTVEYNGNIRVINDKLVQEIKADFDVENLDELKAEFNKQELKDAIKEYGVIIEKAQIDFDNGIDNEQTGEQLEALYDKLQDSKELKMLAKYDLDTVNTINSIITGKYALQNKLLDIHFDILANPDKRIQSQILEPLGFGTLKDDAAKIDGYLKEDKIFSPLSDEYQKMKYINATAGKAGVGVFSMDSVFNALLQGVTEGVELVDIKGKAISIKFGKHTSNALSDSKSVKGTRYKSQVIAAYQSAAVDNEKEQILDKLNINSHTFDVIAILNQVGFEEDVVTALINQPIIREYVKQVIKANDITSGNISNVESFVYDELRKLYKSNVYKFDTHSNLADKSANDMLENIKNVQNTLSYNNIQLAVLDKFLSLKGKGLQLKEIQSTINSDSAGLSKSLIETQAKQSSILSLYGNKGFSNIEKLIGDYKSEAELNDLSEEEQEKYSHYAGLTYIKPSTINGYVAVYGLALNNKMWSNEFHYHKTNVNKAFDTIVKLTGKEDVSVSQQNTLKQEVWGNIKSYLFTSPESNLYNKDVTQLRNELLFDNETNESLATKIKDLQGSSIGVKNAFLNKLSTNIQKGQKPSLVTFNASTGENFDETNIYAAFVELLVNDRKINETLTTRELAEDLIRYQFLTGGLQQAKQFIKYIPVAYLNEIGFSKYLDTSIEGLDAGFVRQFVQNNAGKAPRLTEDIYGSDVSKLEKFTVPTESIAKFSDALGNLLPYISVYNGSAESGYSLYENDGNGTYHKIDTLGSTDFKEYNINSTYATSTIKSNNTNTKLERPTYTKSTPVIEESEILNSYGISFTTSETERTRNFLTNVKNNSNNKLYKVLAGKMLDNIDKTNTPLVLDKTINTDGKHLDGTVFINPNRIKSTEQLEKVLLHELVHAFTVKGLEGGSRSAVRIKGLFNEFKDSLSKEELQTVLTKLGKIRKGENITFSQNELDVIYGGVNVKEFVALVMTSKDMQKLLNKTMYLKDKNFLLELIDRIVEVLNTLGLKKSSDLKFAIHDIFDLIDSVEATSEDFLPSQASTFELQMKLGVMNKDGSHVKYDNVNVSKLKKEFADKLPKGYTIKTHKVENKTVFYVQPLIEEYSVTVDEDTNKGRYGKFGKLVRETDSRISYIKSTISKAKQSGDFKTAIDQEARLEEVESDLERLLDATKLEDIAFYAEKDIAEIGGILENPNATAENLDKAEKLIHIWQKGIDLFFSKEEKTSDILVDEFAKYQVKADRLGDRLANKQNEVARKLITRLTGKDISIAEAFKEFKDVNGLTSRTLDISHADNILLQAIWKNVKLANNEARLETEKVVKSVDELISNADSSLGKGRDKYKIFKQLTKGGEWTGDLVHRFSKEYFDEKSTKLNKANRVNTKAGWNSYFKWRKENELIFDVRMLFPDTDLYTTTLPQKVTDNHIKELKGNLGEKGYKNFYSKLSKKLEQFKILRELEQDRIELMNLEPREQEKQLKLWDYKNSPYYASESFATGKGLIIDKKLINSKGAEHTIVVPKKIDSKGNTTKWYDSSFEQIEDNDALSNLYDYMLDTFNTLNTILPDNQKRRIRENTVPEIKKSIIEAFSDNGIKGGLGSWYNKLIQDISVNELSDTTYAEKDAVTGEVKKQLKVKHIVDNTEKFKELMKRGRIEFELANNKKPNIDDIHKIRDNVNKELLKEKSFDLGVIIKAYSGAVLAYKHKSVVESELKLVNSILSNAKETEFNAQGGKLKTPDGTLAKKSQADSYVNVKAMLKHYTDNFYDVGKKLEGVSGKKSYTPQQKKEKKNIEQLLAENEVAFTENKIDEKKRDLNKSTLTEQLDNLGSNKVASKIGDKALQYVQLKGMAYNVISGFSNMAFGFVDNITAAADGRLYSGKDYRKGFGMVLRSIGGKSEDAKKITNLMKHLDVLKDASDELFESSSKSVLQKRMKHLAPYEVQKRTEYINQAPIMIAMLNSNKVEGKETTLWESLNEDGSIKEGSGLTKKQLDDFKVKLDQTIKMLHGNYDTDSTIMGKATITGRALMQFRTWMFEGAHKRFGAEKFDSNLGLTRKGRYRSIYENLDVSALITTSKVLLKKLTFNTAFKNTKFEDRFNEVDAANMKANLTELMIYMGLYGMSILLKMSMDDEDEKNNFIGNHLLNQMLRLETDITFYTSPVSFEALTKSSVPAMSLITDVGQWFEATGKFVIGEDEIKSGVNSGDSRLLRETSQMIPLGTQIYRIKSAGSQIFDK